MFYIVFPCVLILLLERSDYLFSILNVEYLGYKRKSVEFVLTKKNPDLRLKEIKLETSSEMLSEVTIEEEKPIYESKIDKIVYNAENDLNEAIKKFNCKASRKKYCF